MAKIRHEKVGALLQGLISQFFLENNDRLDTKSMALVDAVFVSPDLHYADVYVSFSPFERERAEEWLKGVQDMRQEIQNYVFREMGLRRAPEIRFYLSDPDKSFQMNQLFGNLGNHGSDDSDSDKA